VLVAFFGGVGAGVGALIDAAITTRTMIFYQAPGQRTSALRFSPRLTKSAAGIQMSVSF
jgi:hypothetical protein